jgi:N-acetylneuraminic acid mutarotase
MILFGGESNQRTSYSDTWEYDPAKNVWTERFPDIHPTEIDASSVVYDSESDKFLFYFSLALDSTAPSGLRGTSETWAYDFSTNTWENMNPTTHPEGIMGPRMAYDSESDRIILFGGGDFTASEITTFTETWAYDYNSNQWERMNPAQTPIGRSYFGMAYAPDRDEVFVFGGRLQTQDEDRQNELWAYDYNSDTWNEIAFSGEPRPDHHSMMVYNSTANQLWYLVNTNLNAFDLNTLSWETLDKGPTNLPIHFHAMAVDASGNLIVFGGGASGLAYNNWNYK